MDKRFADHNELHASQGLTQAEHGPARVTRDRARVRGIKNPPPNTGKNPAAEQRKREREQQPQPKSLPEGDLLDESLPKGTGDMGQSDAVWSSPQGEEEEILWPVVINEVT